MICHNNKCAASFDPTRYNQKYCTVSCRNYGKVRAWRNKQGHRCACGQYILPESSKCKKCSVEAIILFTKDLTLGDYQNLPSVKGRHPSWKNSHVRSFARVWNKSLDKQCRSCGYNKHVEMAHRKPIKDFLPTATLGEINSIDNIIPLCPNCHWEFDNGILASVV